MAMSIRNIIVFHILAAAAIFVLCVKRTEGLGTFEFPLHHKYSEIVKKILKIDGIPDKNTFAYHARMLHHDGRRLAVKFGSTPLVFAGEDLSYQIGGQYGNLYYSIMPVGAPSKPYLVALDTGSDLAWLSCSRCTGASCAFNLETKSGKGLDYNQYNPNISTTSTIIPCSSTECLSGYCVAGTSSCYFDVSYVDGTSVSGSLIEDTLHLVTDDASQSPVDAALTFGCATFRSRVIDPGLIGLGVEKYSLPSLLAGQGLIADSFSMCFGADGTGKIVFGDKGSLVQGETPFFDHPYFGPTYAIGMTQITVGAEATNVGITPIVDSGFTYSYFEDPAYSIITKNFDTQVKDTRYVNQTYIPFEYCYNLGGSISGPDTPNVPSLSFTMKGGDKLGVAKSIGIYTNEDRDGYIYCLTIRKSVNYSVIGQNFWTGYQVIFDRERKMLGWKSSICNGENSGTGPPAHPPPSPLSTPPSPLKTPPSASPPPPRQTPSPPLRTPPPPPSSSTTSTSPPPQTPPSSFPTSRPPPSSFVEQVPPSPPALFSSDLPPGIPGSALKLSCFSSNVLIILVAIFIMIIPS
ncbi:aspartic protease [Lithospermum erythrorhizon]|uniref:Aspartic protease n=1 Tax=Lithospermum erythrorhizon TaxID=34254 RepID=A0AAV3QTM8_LITER